MSHCATPGEAPAYIQNARLPAVGGTVEQMQSGNLQYQDHHVVENMRSGGLQYNQPSNFQGETPQYAENMSSGGLQFYDPNAVSHDEEKRPAPPIAIPVEKIDPPVELPLAGQREDNIPTKRIFGLRRRIFWLLAAILALVVVGAVVGGVVAGTQKRQSTASTDPAATGAASAISSGSDTLFPQSTIIVTSTGSAGLTTVTIPVPATTNSAPPATPSTVTVVSTASPTSSDGGTSSAAQPTAPAPTFSSGVWYRFTNLYLGSASSLDVVNDNGVNSVGTLQMAATGDYSGQYWQIVGSPGSGYYLRTSFLGSNMRLDVTTGTAPTPHLAPAAGDDGQIWTFTPWSDGTYRLTSKATGDGLHLDTYSDTKAPFMGDGDHSGQHWNITEIEPIPVGYASVNV